MANFVHKYVQDLQQEVNVRNDGTLTFEGDNLSNEIQVEITNGGAAASVSGTVVGYAIRANGSTVVMAGTLTGNVASVILPEACFAYLGMLGVSVQLVTGSVKTTLFKAVYQVEEISTSVQVDPGDLVPDISDLLAMLDQMGQATDAANAAAASALTNFAGAFSPSTPYTAGKYVTYTDGKFYRFTVDHAAGSWTGTDVVAVTAGGELSELKSALEVTTNKTNKVSLDFYGSEEATYTTGGYIKTGGIEIGAVVDFTPVSNADYVYAVLPCVKGDSFVVSGGSGNAPRVWAFTDSDKKLLSVDVAYVQRTNEVIYAPENSAYAVFNSGTEFTYSATKYAQSVLSGELIEIGTGTSIPSLDKGFAMARSTNKGVIISPGIYNLRNYGYTIDSLGLIAPKVIYGYGVTLNLLFDQYSASDPNCSAINIDKIPSCEIYGLTIHCKNARYCIHDELYNYDAPYYHHVFKDLALIHECDTGTSGLWVAPRAIGGGLGNGGLIEITNCLTYSAAYEDINYHSKAGGSAQTGEVTIIIKDCAMRKNASVSNAGTSTDYMNKMLVSNCITGKAVADGVSYNIKKISWNMNVLSGGTSEFDSLFNLVE